MHFVLARAGRNNTAFQYHVQIRMGKPLLWEMHTTGSMEGRVGEYLHCKPLQLLLLLQVEREIELLLRIGVPISHPVDLALDLALDLELDDQATRGGIGAQVWGCCMILFVSNPIPVAWRYLTIVVT